MCTRFLDAQILGGILSKRTNVCAKSQENIKKCEKRIIFDENAPMWVQKVKRIDEMGKEEEFQWKRTNVSAKSFKKV